MRPFGPAFGHCLAIIFFGWFAIGNASETDEARAKLTMIVVVGAAGEPGYEKQFSSWKSEWLKLGKLADAEIVEIGIGSDQEVDDLDRLSASLKKSKHSGATDGFPLWLVFIGHGTYQGGVAKFNLRGPDVSSEQLATFLYGIGRQVVIINTSSSSGPFINAVSGQGRVVVTATKSGEEQNFARFGAYLPAALQDPQADLDHDGEVSLLEAVVKASGETQNFYVSEDRIQTEHALLDDNGDQLGTPSEMLTGILRGTPVKVAENKKTSREAIVVDGDVAAGVVLVPSSDHVALLPEEQNRRTEVEVKLRSLKRRKSTVDEAEYYAELETHLLELAKIYQAAEERQKSDVSSP